MSNKNLFANTRKIEKANTVNRAGGKAYELSAHHALAQIAVTGCFNNTYYAKAEDHLSEVMALSAKADPEFLAKLAVYARQEGYMKDMPAYLAAVLAGRDVELLSRVFDRVIDNGKMLRNFVQIMRSGQAGRKSLGSRPKKLVQNWLNKASDYQIMSASVGNSPSLSDVIRMVHPKAEDVSREAFYGYVMRRKEGRENWPAIVKELEAFRAGDALSVPKVPFELLTTLDLSTKNWAEIALNGGWHMVRMNLNTFARNGVFKDREVTSQIADKLRDTEAIRKAKVFPYQLLAAYLNASDDVPVLVKNALQDAMEIATENVPAFAGRVAVFVDVSGSMKDPVTGGRKGSSSKIRCIDVAGLVASTILRKNPDAVVIPFDTRVRAANHLNSRDAVVTNAAKLAKFGGGGTNCSVALRSMNGNKIEADLCIYVSDNESWVDSNSDGTVMMREWAKFKRNNKRAKLVCLDITPNTTTQANEQKDVLNIGGFSDNVFTVIERFAKNEMDAGHWVGVINQVEI
jgi:60 kDa SS-A/Ro ribonucleoprotein